MSETISSPETNEADNTETEQHSYLKSLLNTTPNLIVFSLLIFVMYYGHRFDWKFPSSGSVFADTLQEKDDWCSEHLVPESKCIECNLDLYPKNKEFGFCHEHGVAECVFCHPELAQIKGKINQPKYDSKKAIALLPRTENNSRNILHRSRIQFDSIQSIEKYGIEIDLVEERMMSDKITANGEIVFNPTRIAHLRTKVPGTVVMVFKTLGDSVKSGDIVALVDAVGVGQAKSQFLQAFVRSKLKQKTVNRLQPLINSGAVSKQKYLEAESALQEEEILLLSARQTLSNLGFELPDIKDSIHPKTLSANLKHLGILPKFLASISKVKQTANLIPVLAPLDGVIVSSETVAGETVEISTLMATVADPKQLWLFLNVRQEDARFIQTGLPVLFQTDDGVAKVNGTISWINPAIDQKTRTLQVRVILSNDADKLKDRMFGTGHIILREEPNAIVVPREAIQSMQDAHFVFVRDKNYFEKDAPKFFHVRQVRTGAQDDNFIELLAGVVPGEVIATKGSNALLGQLLRSNFGAGCGCHKE